MTVPASAGLVPAGGSDVDPVVAVPADTPALSDLLGALDPEQRAAAEAPVGPVCILAGAGTGKTRAITARIARLVTTGTITPDSVLAGPSPPAPRPSCAVGYVLSVPPACRRALSTRPHTGNSATSGRPSSAVACRASSTARSRRLRQPRDGCGCP